MVQEAAASNHKKSNYLITNQLAIRELGAKDIEFGIDQLLERILIWAQSKFGEDELINAREDYYQKNGKIFHDDQFYDQRICYFLDYFLLQRELSLPTSGKISTPLQCFLEQSDNSATNFRYLHSLFETLKSDETKLTLIDLIENQRLEVSPRPGESFRGFKRKDLFQCFLYYAEGRYWLSPGIIFHPAKASRTIKRGVKSERKKETFDTRRTLSMLAKQNLKHLRHAHVDPKKIYGLFD